MALTELVQASTAEASGAQRVSRGFLKLYASVAVSRDHNPHRTTAVQRDFESAGSRSPGTCCRRVLQETQSQGNRHYVRHRPRPTLSPPATPYHSVTCAFEETEERPSYIEAMMSVPDLRNLEKETRQSDRAQSKSVLLRGPPCVVQ